MAIRVLNLVKTSVGATWALRQMREHCRRGLDVHVAVPDGGPRIAEYRAAGVTVHPQEYALSGASALKHGLSLRRLVASLEPSIVHSWFAQTTLYARTFLFDFKGPRVFQVPGPLHLENRLWRRADVGSARANDFWIGMSRHIVGLYRDAGVEPQRVGLAYCGIDLDYYTPTAPGFLRDRFGIAASDKIVGIVSYIYPPNRWVLAKRGVKGHEDLIDAFSLVLRRRSDVVLVIVGKQWGGGVSYEQRLKRYAQERCGHRVLFVGFFEDVRKAYADFDVFAYPSRSENLGGVFESLMLGVPTVGTRVGGIPEAVIDGVTGLLVDRGDTVGLAAAIESLLDDRENALKMAARGRKHLSSLLDVNKSSMDVLKIYEKLLSDGTLGPS